jgi:TIR domain
MTADTSTFQLALSYADADREYVEKFATALEKHGVHYYDPKNDLSGLGQHRAAVIQRIYSSDTQHVILFISEAYVTDPNLRIERLAALDQNVEEPGFVLPARFDGSSIPGLDNLIGVDLRDKSPEHAADAVVDWLEREDPEIRRRPAIKGWEAFDPARLHCVVVGSEAEESAGAKGLAAAFSEVLHHEFPADEVKNKPGIWIGVSETLRTLELLSGRRPLPATYDEGAVEPCAFSATNAFASDTELRRAIRLIIEADLALFDVTDFEPGVMLLLGVRAATRRGVTIVSHGAEWFEGTPLRRPFNLADLSLASHTPIPVKVGVNPRRGRLAERIQVGFQQLGRHPDYHDLPVYDALRRLGSESSAWWPIPADEEILVLCTYDGAHEAAWTSVQQGLTDARPDVKVKGTLSRMQDFATPQIVSQALYEKIRRCVGCIVDWTLASPSTFFELGVRLAISQWGTVQIASKGWLDLMESGATDGNGEPLSRSKARRQVRSMRHRFQPIAYAADAGVALGQEVAATLLEISESGPAKEHDIHRVAVEAMQRVEPTTTGVVLALEAEADRLDSPQLGGQHNVPQALFHEAQSIKRDHERAALEQRLAAWFYLEHRLGAGQRSEGDPLRRRWVKLGLQVSRALLEPGSEEADQDLGIEISRQVRARRVEPT